MEKIIITTAETITGRQIVETLGLVKGNSVRTRHIGSHIMAGLTTLVGGEVKGYVTAITSARDEATNRMIEEAQALNANAIICARYSSSQIMNGAAEILAYGTAVRIK